MDCRQDRQLIARQLGALLFAPQELFRRVRTWFLRLRGIFLQVPLHLRSRTDRHKQTAAARAKDVGCLSLVLTLT